MAKSRMGIHVTRPGHSEWDAGALSRELDLLSFAALRLKNASHLNPSMFKCSRLHIPLFPHEKARTTSPSGSRRANILSSPPPSPSPEERPPRRRSPWRPRPPAGKQTNYSALHTHGHCALHHFSCIHFTLKNLNAC